MVVLEHVVGLAPVRRHKEQTKSLFLVFNSNKHTATAFYEVTLSVGSTEQNMLLGFLKDEWIQ